MLLQFRDEVETALTGGLDALDLPTDDLGIEEPPEDVEAVLASSVAFRLAQERQAPPPQVAASIADAIDLEGLTYVEAIRAEGPYLNAYPSPAYARATLEAGQDAGYGRLEPTGERIVVEHTSANPTGPVHVGRARNPIVGDAVANVLEFAGHDVDRHYYVNDAGRQMAVFTWAYETFDEDDLEGVPARDRIEYDLVRYYQQGNAVLEEGDEETVAQAEAEIAEIMRGLEAGDEETHERVGHVVDQVLGGMRECLGRLPAPFDEFVKETRFMRDGSVDALVERLRELDEAVYEEEAWQLDLAGHGIEKKLVFLRADGTSLYTTRDLAHHEWKFDGYDRAVTVLGEDHKLQAEQLVAALDLLGNDVDRLESVIYSYVNLPEGKMSTRRGTGVMLDDLLDEAIDRARTEVESRLEGRIRDDDLTPTDVERIAHQVGIGAVRYDIVAQQPTKPITFEWDRALDFEAQSAPYVQYAHARCCGILEAAGMDLSAIDPVVDPDRGAVELVDPGLDVDVESLVEGAVDPAVLETDAEQRLLRTIARFPAVVETAAESLEPHRIATYTRTFAEDFNAFYRDCPVLDPDLDPDVVATRLALVAGARTTIARALALLGVAAPRSM